MTPPNDTTIFVFGSNLAGVHGAGSALEAKRNWGAIQGCGWGRQGQSYAIPTKGTRFQILDLNAIQLSVTKFLSYAEAHPELQFQVVDVGCGLAGYHHSQIASFFNYHPNNVTFLGKFKDLVRPRGVP